jgi:hypothetical protein
VFSAQWGNPLALALYSDGVWAHQGADFRWEQFDLDRTLQFNDLANRA